MNVYLVRHNGPIPYDAYDAHVVVARDEAEARSLCGRSPADEGHAVWLSAAVECVGRARDSAPPMIVLSSFNAG